MRLTKGRATMNETILATSLDPVRRGALCEAFTVFHVAFPSEPGICVPRESWLKIGVRV
jgi:hypothetical protein